MTTSLRPSSTLSSISRTASRYRPARPDGRLGNGTDAVEHLPSERQRDQRDDDSVGEKVACGTGTHVGSNSARRAVHPQTLPVPSVYFPTSSAVVTGCSGAPSQVYGATC